MYTRIFERKYKNTISVRSQIRIKSNKAANSFRDWNSLLVFYHLSKPIFDSFSEYLQSPFRDTINRSSNFLHLFH